jgi:hypothetical protein
MSNIVINNSVDVVELHSNTDLTLESNTQIKFSTHNILINYIPFNEYIHKVVFNTDITTITLSDSSSVHSWENAVDIDTITNKINLTDNTSELIVDELHCSGISAATHSYVNNKYHYINLSATDNIYIKNNTNSSNIVYNKIDDVMYSFSNYIYKIVNNPASHTTDSLSPESITINSINRTDISSLGSYIGKRIVTSNISTSNVFVHPGNEPILEFDSQTAVNFFTNVYSNPGDVNAGLKIHFGDITLDELVKSQLDERGLITIGATMTSGQDIGMELTTLTHTKGYDFIYDIVFHLYEHDVTLPYPDNMLSSPIIDSISHSSIALATISFPFGIHYFTGLSPGQFYTVFGTFTNTRTGTVVENIEVTGGQNIATIKNIYDISVTVINEETIGIQFKGHDTVVASWSASGKRIKFSVSVNGYSGEINSGLTQNLSQISPDTSLKTFNLSVSSIVGYGNSGILRVSSFQTNAKTINIISNHVEGGTFEMSQSAPMTLFTFVAPRHPPSLSINYVYKRLTWNHTNNPVDRLKTIYFELYKGSTKEYDGINKLFGIGPSSVGSWTVKAKNVYGQLSGVSNSLDIITPSFDVGSITSIGNKTFNIGISNVNTNGTYTLSGTNINTSSSSSIITSILIPGTYTFRVNLTDQLGLVASRNTSSLTINTPSVVFDPPSFRYSGTLLRYFVTISISNSNGSWGIHGTPSSVGGTYNSISGNNLYFTFLSNDLGGNKMTSVTIKDSYGYEANTPVHGTINLSITFTNPILSLSVTDTVASFDPTGLTSYKWYRNNSLILSEITKRLTLTIDNFGEIFCTAIQTNNEGFIRTIESSTITNIEPSIYNEYFANIGFTGGSYVPVYSFLNGPDTTLKIIGAGFDIQLLFNNSIVTTYRGDGEYILSGTLLNSYGVEKQINIGTLNYINPTPPIISVATNVSHYSMTISYNLGINGSQILELVELHYGRDTGFDYTINLNINTQNNDIDVSLLDHNTKYYFKIVKKYFLTGNIESSATPHFSQNTAPLTQPTPITGITYTLSSRPSDNKIQVAFNWTDIGTNGNPLGTPSDIRAYYSNSEFIITALPTSFVSIIENTPTLGIVSGDTIYFRLVKIYSSIYDEIVSDSIKVLMDTRPVIYVNLIENSYVSPTEDIYDIVYTHNYAIPYTNISVWAYMYETDIDRLSSDPINSSGNDVYNVYNDNTYYSNYTISTNLKTKFNPYRFLFRIIQDGVLKIINTIRSTRIYSILSLDNTSIDLYVNFKTSNEKIYTVITSSNQVVLNNVIIEDIANAVVNQGRYIRLHFSNYISFPGNSIVQIKETKNTNDKITYFVCSQSITTPIIHPTNPPAPTLASKTPVSIVITWDSSLNSGHGDPEDTYNPDSAISRVEFVVYYRVIDITYPLLENSFFNDKSISDIDVIHGINKIILDDTYITNIEPRYSINTLVPDNDYWFRIFKVYTNPTYNFTYSEYLREITNNKTLPLSQNVTYKPSETTASSITIYWSDLGTNGDPSVTPVSVKLYKSYVDDFPAIIDSSTESLVNISTYTLNNTTGSVTYNGIFYNQINYFKMVKYYNTPPFTDLYVYKRDSLSVRTLKLFPLPPNAPTITDITSSSFKVNWGYLNRNGDDGTVGTGTIIDLKVKFVIQANLTNPTASSTALAEYTLNIDNAEIKNDNSVTFDIITVLSRGLIGPYSSSVSIFKTCRGFLNNEGFHILYTSPSVTVDIIAPIPPPPPIYNRLSTNRVRFSWTVNLDKHGNALRTLLHFVHSGMFGLGKGLHLITDIDKSRRYKDIDILDNNLGTFFYFENVYEFKNIKSSELYIRTPIFPVIQSVTSPSFGTIRVNFSLGNTGFPPQTATYTLYYRKFGNLGYNEKSISGDNEVIYGLMPNNEYRFYILANYGPIFDIFITRHLTGVPVDQHITDYSNWTDSTYKLKLLGVNDMLGFVNNNDGADATVKDLDENFGFQNFKFELINIQRTECKIKNTDSTTVRYIDNDFGTGDGSGYIELRNDLDHASRKFYIDKVVQTPYDNNNNKIIKLIRTGDSKYCINDGVTFRCNGTSSKAQVFELIKI